MAVDRPRAAKGGSPGRSRGSCGGTAGYRQGWLRARAGSAGRRGASGLQRPLVLPALLGLALCSPSFIRQGFIRHKLYPETGAGAMSRTAKVPEETTASHQPKRTSENFPPLCPIKARNNQPKLSESTFPELQKLIKGSQHPREYLRKRMISVRTAKFVVF